MATYNVEITQPTKNLKALNLVSSLSGLDLVTVRSRLQSLPMTVRDNLALTEAVTLERQLKRLGLSVRIVKLQVSLEDPTDRSFIPVLTRPAGDDVIEIPEEEIRELPLSVSPQPKIRIKKKKITPVNRYRNWALGLLIVTLFGLVLFYALSNNLTQRQNLDLADAIQQWSKTLIEQETLLDQGVTPQQIFNKLMEIEAKINRLLALMKSPQVAEEMKARYTQVKALHPSALRDLDFRRDLENAGYPLHPTCLIDRGTVVGASDLPEETRLRLRLYGDNGLDSVSYTAQINEGVFRLNLDSEAERSVYDARATIAPFTEQPPAVQKWASLTFSLHEISSPPEARPVPSKIPNVEPQQIAQVPLSDTQDSASRTIAPPDTVIQTTRSLQDSLADVGILAAFNATVKEWTTTIESAQKQEPKTWDRNYEAIYQKLLQLEKQIDHLIQLLRSDTFRNQSILAREEAYGASIAFRQSTENHHQDFLRRNNPFYLETAIRRDLVLKGWVQVQVLVLDSPNQAGAFVVEIDLEAGAAETVFPLLAQVLSAEARKTLLDLEYIRLRLGRKTLYWTTEQIQQAAEALAQPEGSKRCVAILQTTNLAPALK